MALKDSFTTIRYFTSADVYYYTTDNRPLTDLKSCLDFLADTIDARGGWGEISSATASSSATIDFTNLTGYSAYTFIITTPLIPATNAVDLWMRVSEDNGGTFKSGGTDYVYGSYDIASNNTSGINGASTGAAQMIVSSSISNSATNGISGYIYADNLGGTTTNKRLTWRTNRYNGTNHVALFGGGLYVTDQAAINAVRFLFSSGNIASGTIKAFGLRG